MQQAKDTSDYAIPCRNFTCRNEPDTRDSETALQLVCAKDRFRNSERHANTLHFQRRRDGGARSIDTSSLHLDTIRDLKQINALLAGLAYPVLEQQGLLLETRLRPSVAKPA